MNGFTQNKNHFATPGNNKVKCIEKLSKESTVGFISYSLDLTFKLIILKPVVYTPGMSHSNPSTLQSNTSVLQSNTRVLLKNTRTLQDKHSDV